MDALPPELSEPVKTTLNDVGMSPLLVLTVAVQIHCGDMFVQIKRRSRDNQNANYAIDKRTYFTESIMDHRVDLS